MKGRRVLAIALVLLLLYGVVAYLVVMNTDVCMWPWQRLDVGVCVSPID